MPFRDRSSLGSEDWNRMAGGFPPEVWCGVAGCLGESSVEARLYYSDIKDRLRSWVPFPFLGPVGGERRSECWRYFCALGRVAGVAPCAAEGVRLHLYGPPPRREESQ